jgi:hypothetical protein
LREFYSDRLEQYYGIVQAQPVMRDIGSGTQTDRA